MLYSLSVKKGSIGGVVSLRQNIFLSRSLTEKIKKKSFLRECFHSGGGNFQRRVLRGLLQTNPPKKRNLPTNSMNFFFIKLTILLPSQKLCEDAEWLDAFT